MRKRLLNSNEMRAHRIVNKFGCRFLVGRLDRWSSGTGPQPCPTNIQAEIMATTRVGYVTAPLRQPVPEKGHDQLIMANSDTFQLLYKLGLSPASTSRLLLPSVALFGSIIASLAPSRAVVDKSVASGWRGSFRYFSDSNFSGTEAAQVVESNVSAESDIEQSVRAISILALKEYLRDVKGVSEEDAQFISRNCPTFIAKLVEAVTSHVGEQETLELRIQGFLLNADLEASHEVTEAPALSSSRGETGGQATLGHLVQLSMSPLALARHGGVAGSMAVLDSLGWSRRTFGDILERNPGLSTWTAAELRANIDVLEGVGVKSKDMLSLVEDASVFKADLKKTLAPLLQYLGTVGIKDDVVGDLMKFNPQGLIKMPLDNFRERVQYLLELGLSSTEVEKCMRVFPQLVHLRLANLNQKIEYFNSIGLDRDRMVKIVAKLPSIFRHSIERNLVPKVQMLQNLGVMNGSLAKIVANYPQIFGCSMENLRLKVAFFETNGLTGSRLAKMIMWHPRTFAFSVDENLSKKLQFLVNKGFVSGSTSMARALASCSTISIQSLEARFENLQSFGFTPEEVSGLVKKQPTIFCLSQNTIRLKMDYLLNDICRFPEEVLKCPGYLLYSLEYRVKPRFLVLNMLLSRGFLVGRARGCDSPAPYSLSTILQPSENTFIQRFASLHPDCLEAYMGNIQGSNGKQAREVHQLPRLDLPLETDGNLANASKLVSPTEDLDSSRVMVVGAN